MLTQEQVAERTGLAVRTVRRLESGNSPRVRSTTVRTLAAALGLNSAEQEILAAAARSAPKPATGGDSGDPDVPGAAPSAAVPRQLPASPPAFTGRVAELTDLDRLVDATAVVITAIDGMAGIGKTALAVHAAHRLVGHFPDGQIFVDLHGYTEGVPPVEPGAALERILRLLGVPGAQIPRPLDDRAALYRTWLADRKILILLDNAANEAQVEPLLPGSPGCLVLVTGRRRLGGLDHTRTLSLDVLPVRDAVALFARIAGEQRSAAEPPELLVEVVELCGRLPLAIRIAAARLRSRPRWTAAHLLERLRDQRRRLAELEAGERSVTAALDLSYQQLTPELRRAYRLCGLHPGTELDTHAVAALTDRPGSEAARLVDHLLGDHLLTEPAAGRFAFHDLARVHAAAMAGRDETESDQQAALVRLADHYCHAASLAMDVVYPSERERRPPIPPAGPPTLNLNDPADASAWLDTELPNLLAVAQYAAGRDRSWATHPTLHLSAVLHRHLLTRGRYGDAEILHDLALATARRTESRVGELRALLGLGGVRGQQGRHGPAAEHFTQALAIARALGERIGEVSALTGLGSVQRLQGRNEEAADSFAQARETARASGDRRGELNAVNGLGYVEWTRGRLEQAASSFAEAREIARAISDRTGELNALLGLGWIHRQRGQHEQVVGVFEEALAASRAIGSRDGELSAMTGLGWAHRKQGRLDQAADIYQRILGLAREIGNRNMQFEATQGMGRLQHAAGRPDQALVHHREALALATDLGQPADQVRAHDGLAHAHVALDQREQGRQHWTRALEILTGLGTDYTEDEETTGPAIRAHLRDLGDD